MSTLSICQNILEETRKQISSSLYTKSFRIGNHFTRNRELKMEQVIFYLLHSSKASMNLNIANIQDDIPVIKFPDVTKQAVSKARQGIDPELFRDLFHLSSEMFYRSCTQRKTWNGFHLYAVDGSCIQVPKSKDNIEYFGLCRNRHHSREDSMARISILYDLLEDIVIDGVVNPYLFAERSSANKHLDYLGKR